MKTVVLNESFLKDTHLDRLKKLGEVEVLLGTTSEDLAIERLKGADVAIADMFESPLNKTVLANVPSVKFISINTTGFDLVDIASARENNITVSNVPGFGTQGVAEHAIALLFATVRHIVADDKAMRAGPFQLDPANRDHDRYLGTDVYGKTIGIIGLGQIGTRVAELAMALGMNVLTYNRSPREVAGIEMVSLEELLKRSDVVSLNGAYSPDQENLINEDMIALMKKTAVLINTARGSFVDDTALAKALTENRIAGAGLDFLHDWSSDNPLLKLDNVVLTPHVGWFTEESLANLADIIVENVEAFASGKPINVISMLATPQ